MVAVVLAYGILTASLTLYTIVSTFLFILIS